MPNAAAGSTDNLVFVNGHGQYTPTAAIDTGTDADVTVDTTSGGAATLDFLRADFGNAQTAVNMQITKPIIGGSILTLNGRRCKVMSVGATAADGQTFTAFFGANNDYEGTVCAYDVITQAAAIHLDSAPAHYEYMGGTFCSLAPPTTALAEPVATGGKASTAGATDGGTTGDSYSRLLASGAASDRAHGSCHTSVSASAMHISSRSLAPPTTTLAEPIAPEPPPPTLAPVSTALCPQRPRFRHTPQRLRQVQLRRLRP